MRIITASRAVIFTTNMTLTIYFYFYFTPKVITHNIFFDRLHYRIFDSFPPTFAYSSNCIWDPWKNVGKPERAYYLLFLHWRLECRFKCVLNERIACAEDGIAGQKRVVSIAIAKKPRAPAHLQVRTARSAAVEVIAFVARVGVEKKQYFMVSALMRNSLEK